MTLYKVCLTKLNGLKSYNSLTFPELQKNRQKGLNRTKRQNPFVSKINWFKVDMPKIQGKLL